MIRMRVFNSYKQIKFSQVGIGGKPQPSIFNRVSLGTGEMPKIDEFQKKNMKRASLQPSPRDNVTADQVSFVGGNSTVRSAYDEAKDSIYPSEQDDQDQHTQTVFEPFKTMEFPP